MPTQEKECIDIDERDQQRALQSLKATAQMARELPPEDKADLLDLALDLLMDAPRIVEQPERLRDTFKLMDDIVHQRREDVTALDMPSSHDSRIGKGGDPKDYKKWKQWIGEKVRELRKAKDWSQEELAEKSGLRQSHISRIESAKHSPSRRTITRLAEAFGVGVGDLDPMVD